MSHFKKHQQDQTDFDPAFEEELLARFHQEQAEQERRLQQTHSSKAASNNLRRRRRSNASDEAAATQVVVTGSEGSDEETSNDEEDPLGGGILIEHQAQVAEVGCQVTPRISDQTKAKPRAKFETGLAIPDPKTNGTVAKPKKFSVGRGTALSSPVPGPTMMKVGPYLLPAVRSDRNNMNPFANPAKKAEKRREIEKFLQTERKSILPFIQESWEKEPPSSIAVKKKKMKKKKKHDPSTPRTRLMAIRQEKEEQQKLQGTAPPSVCASDYTHRPASRESSGGAQRRSHDEDIDWGGPPPRHCDTANENPSKRSATAPLLPPSSGAGPLIPLSTALIGAVKKTKKQVDADALLKTPTSVEDTQRHTLKLYYQAKKLFSQYSGVPDAPHGGSADFNGKRVKGGDPKFPLAELFAMENQLQASVQEREDQRRRVALSVGCSNATSDAYSLSPTSTPQDQSHRTSMVPPGTSGDYSYEDDWSGDEDTQGEGEYYHNQQSPSPNYSQVPLVSTSRSKGHQQVKMTKERHSHGLQQKNSPTASRFMTNVISGDRKNLGKDLERMKSSAAHKLHPVPIQGDYGPRVFSRNSSAHAK